MRRSIISLTICLCIVFISLFYVPSVSAQSSVEYTKQKNDNSAKYGKTKAEVYYQLIQLKGDTPVIQKINKAIRKDCNKFLYSSYTKRIKEYANLSKEKETYCWEAKTAVKYNKKGIISIVVDTYWWAGGVSNTDRYGLNYSLKTGKKIYLHQACKKSKKTTKKKIFKALKKKGYTKFLSKYDKKRLKKKKIKKYNFYIRKNGKIITTFGPYEIDQGGHFAEFKVGKR